MPRILGITFDGLLQPLGYSQVARVVAGLSGRGLEYTVLSLERERHLLDRAHVQRVHRHLQDAGVRWVSLPYREGGGARATAENMRAALVGAHRLASSTRFDLVHARALHAGLIARALRASRGAPYLFDARAYWVDELAEEGRRFRSPGSYRTAKAVERRLFADAAAVVTLTELQADDVRAGTLGPWRGRPVDCIPTCADYDEFVPVERGAALPVHLRTVPHGARLLGLVGSINRSYHTDESLELARLILEHDSAFHLVVLSDQRQQYEHALKRAGIPADRALITCVPHHDMPLVLPHLEWAPLLLRENLAKRASMPTKLAEFFATGVRVAQIGCNPEVSEWVARSRSGFVLTDLSAASLRDAATKIVASERTAEDVAAVRARTTGHFSLESGVRRYHSLIERAL